MKKMVIIFILALLVVISVFTGCSKKSENSSQQKEEGTINVTTSAAPSNTATVEVSPSVSSTGKGKCIVIDPGHQGPNVVDNGVEAIGPGSSEMKAKIASGTSGTFTGTPEYQLNLDISLALRDALTQRGYNVVMTREDNDTDIGNIDRAKVATENGGDILVRIHANGSDDSSVNGALALAPSSSNPYLSADLISKSGQLAQSVLDVYCQSTGFGNSGIQYRDDQTGINWSTVPVIVLEMGFMTNEGDDTRMQDAGIRSKMVEGIANGIDTYFQTEK